MQGPPCSMTEHPMTEWSVQVRGAVQTHWDHSYVFSLAFPFRRSRAKAIFLSTIFIWGKWTLTKLEEWLSWGKNHIMYRQWVVVMRGVYKVHTWLVLCKRKAFLRRHIHTHTHTEIQNHITWAHTRHYNPDSHKPTASKWCSCFQGPLNTVIVHSGRSVSSLQSHPSAPLGTQDQGASPTTASKRPPPPSCRLFLSRGMIPEYLPFLLVSFTCN